MQAELTIQVEGFALDALEQQSALEGVSVEELATFSILYYLADSDSGRIARRLPKARSLNTDDDVSVVALASRKLTGQATYSPRFAVAASDVETGSLQLDPSSEVAAYAPHAA